MGAEAVTALLSHLERWRADSSVNTPRSTTVWPEPATPEGQAQHNFQQPQKVALAWQHSKA